MYSFKNDYSETVHPNILTAINNLGLKQNDGYGTDSYCEDAKKIILKVIECDNADVHFLPGGTITNLTFISHALRPYQAVISANTAHINIHETGAIEACGHKIVDIVTDDGKLTPELIKPVLEQHENEHWVQPKMVFISNPTEIGTIYSKQEIQALYDFCRNQDLLLYLDGARLAMGITAKESDIKFNDLPKMVDAFYIGGTKVGALSGEALVLINESLKNNFRFSMKQRGAILAKGWLLGLQFKELFTDNLYLKLGKHTNDMAYLLQEIIAEKGFDFLAKVQSNQIFPIMPNWLIDKISEQYLISTWSKPNEENTCVRFCTSWATSESDIMAFKDFLTVVLKDRD